MILDNTDSHNSVLIPSAQSALMVHHFLIVTFPAQGHINPALQLAKRLISTGEHNTFVTLVSTHERISRTSASFPDGLAFAPLFDSDDGSDSIYRADDYMSKMRRVGGEAISALIEKAAGEGRPISCIIYTLLFPWTAQVARKFQLFTALLWIQSATVFDINFYYFNGHRDLIVLNINEPEYALNLPDLPLLKSQDLPSFLLPSNSHLFTFRYFQEQFDILSEDIKSFRIIVNTFDELELESLHVIKKFNLVGIGPLIPSAFLDGKDPMDTSFGDDLIDHSKEYLEWLDSKDKLSVVYVSFGSNIVLSDKQMEALARGLVDSGRPFLWVIRDGGKGSKLEILSKEHKGMIVPWCSQVEVLNHDSVGCFVTHCGWNSTLETLAMGVPVVAFPQGTDQGTNAKLLVDVWKVGVRVRPNGEDNVVDSKEIIRCLEQVSTGAELRNNAMKWKDLAREAVKDGGSSQRNLKMFVHEIEQSCL